MTRLDLLEKVAETARPIIAHAARSGLLNEPGVWTSKFRKLDAALTTLDAIPADSTQDKDEIECEVLGQLCEAIGLDCSGCYDKEDLIYAIKTFIEQAVEEADDSTRPGDVILSKDEAKKVRRALLLGDYGEQEKDEAVKILTAAKNRGTNGKA